MDFRSGFAITPKIRGIILRWMVLGCFKKKRMHKLKAKLFPTHLNGCMPFEKIINKNIKTTTFLKSIPQKQIEFCNKFIHNKIDALVSLCFVWSDRAKLTAISWKLYVFMRLKYVVEVLRENCEKVSTVKLTYLQITLKFQIKSSWLSDAWFI